MGGFSISDFSNAIGHAEGYGTPGAIPTRANNPGDLALGDIGYGTLGKGITIFPTPDAGSAALDKQVSMMADGSSKNYSPLESISQIGATYAAGDPAWSKNVAKLLGVDPSSTLGSLISGAAGTMIPQGSTDSKTGVMGLPTWSRLASFVVGLIFVAAGVMMFKTTSTIIETAGNATKKAVELSA